uniref:magnesium transporter NIPA2-like n=1 Tax=Styela clava TaxID=7725 RepID=UPI00193A0848|nr:magnesium transporter NIPA2-like [Styela clava]
MIHTTRVVCTLLQLYYTLVITDSPVFARERASTTEAVNVLLQVSGIDANRALVTVNSARGETVHEEARRVVVPVTDSSDLSNSVNFWLELENRISRISEFLNNTYPDIKSITCKASLVEDLATELQSRIGRRGVIVVSNTQAMDDHPIIHDIELEGGDAHNMDTNSHISHPFYGVMLAVSAAFLVGLSFIFQKKALIKTEAKKKKASFVRTGSLGEFSYLTQWMWWCGMGAMALGEVLNFVAYSIAPAILVTPLGALRVIVSAILSAMFLGERLNVHGQLGILLSLTGSVMVIIHAPRSEKVQTFEQVVVHFTDTTFVIYCVILMIATGFLVFYSGPKYGRTNIMVYISVCNIVGALCVLWGKGLGIAIKDMGSNGESVYLHPIFWMLVLGNVLGIVLQIVYLNKALAVFDTSMITPIKYVFTNVFLVFGSILLFQEFAYMSIEDVIGITCGFVTVVTGVVLLNLFKRSKPQAGSA